eukprot:6149822-Prymnesium_polylepis.1
MFVTFVPVKFATFATFVSSSRDERGERGELGGRDTGLLGNLIQPVLEVSKPPPLSIYCGPRSGEGCSPSRRAIPPSSTGKV